MGPPTGSTALLLLHKREVVCLVHYFNHLLNKPFSVFHIISFFIDDNFP